MPRYQTTIDRLISHECRTVKAGEVFETTFPEGMKLSDTLICLDAPKKKAKGNSDAGKPADTDTATPPAGDAPLT